MRNGNRRSWGRVLDVPEFLPYLWGMETFLCIHHVTPPPLSSYRTYEEWKHIADETDSNFVKGSYRTYEEWKHWFFNNDCSDAIEFLPYLWGMETYPVDQKSRPEGCVLTVPMRNGNLRHFHRQFKKYKVLTVPMRNGNLASQGVARRSLLVLTVPMRNGNNLSTTFSISLFQVLTVPMRNGNFKNILNWKHKFKFLPYLWGMETNFLCHCLPVRLRSYRTYEEWKHK